MKDSSDEAPGNYRKKGLSVSEMLHKRRKTDENEKYVCADFSLGSAAEIERVWSTANYILSDARNKLKPLIFQSTIFLKYNERFSKDKLMAEAVRFATSERS